MPSSIDADTEQVAQVAQALNDTTLESSHQSIHAADAVPMSTSNPDRMVDDDGKIRFRVRQLSALNNVEDNRMKVTLLVERQVDGRLETKKVELVAPTGHEYDGWMPSLPWFPQPEGVGADWGGYHTFYKWQVNGRAMNEDWVSHYDPDWRNKVAEPIGFVDDDGNRLVLPLGDDEAKLMQEKAAELKTVHEKLWGEETGEAN